jgi:2-polyprenyl-3-methyl-5-hydroxy-6-metoxy-1,4-benzoquinol methylase
VLFGLLPRPTLSTGAIIRWHLVTSCFDWLAAGLGDGARVLDVGCGRGEYPIELARRFPSVALACGVDEMRRDAVGRFLVIPPASHSRVRFVEGRFADEVARALGPFDAAVCVDVLEHIRDDAEFVRGLAVAVRPTGRLLLHVPATDQWHPSCRVSQLVAAELEAGMGPHLREGYSRAALEKILSDAGWEVEEMRPTFGRVAALWSDADMALSLRGRATAPLRSMFIPFTIAGAVIAPYCRPRRGNGWLVLAVRASNGF